MDQDVESTADKDENQLYGRCRCCLELGYVKNMWSEYLCDGAQEIYGEMLMETFSVAWESNPSDQELICQMCVDRLRDAHMFKREVLASEHLLKQGIIDSVPAPIEEEHLSDLDEYENISEDVIPDPKHKRGYGETEEQEAETGDQDAEMGEEEEFDYEEVEYLEDEMPPEVNLNKNKLASSAESRSTPKRQRSADSAPKSFRVKSYTEAQLRAAVHEALTSSRPVLEIATRHGIPRKTIIGRMEKLKKVAKKADIPEEMEKLQNQENHHRFVMEVKKVLTYINAMPFKIKSGKYYCAYCHTSRETFEYPRDLRVHTLEHQDDMVQHLDQILRPQFLNEIVRVDIQNLQCLECSIPIKTWNDMFVHLDEKHDTQLDQAYTKIVPYLLKSPKVACALCNEEFSGFQFLDTHMNSHYCNYMCSDCGDTFVTENRLRHHAITHTKGKHPCRYCGKVFSLEKYKRKHEGMVHKDSKLFKCVDCAEAFHSEYERHQHVVQAHKERVRISTCEICGKTYDWKPYYLAHMRKIHHKVKKFACQYCKKAFSTNHEVRNHEFRHTGQGKHACLLCGKRFVTRTEFKKHCRSHAKGMKFVDIDSEEFKDSNLKEIILGSVS